MKEGINRTRAANAKKGSELREQGFATAVHALPQDVKAAIDGLLLTGVSIRETLTSVSVKFPNVHLPSVGALNNYRKKYLGKGITVGEKGLLTEKEQTEMELRVLKVQTSLFEQLEFLVNVLLPRYLKNAGLSLDVEDKIHMVSGGTDKRMDIAARLFKVYDDILHRAGISMMALERKTTTVTVPGQQAQEGEEPVVVQDVYDKLADILAYRGFTIKTVHERGISVHKG